MFTVKEAKEVVDQHIEKKEAARKLEEEYNKRHSATAKGNAIKPNKAEPKSYEWKCYRCGTINHVNFGQCKCGTRKSEAQKYYAEKEERKRRAEAIKNANLNVTEASSKQNETSDSETNMDS